jgi:uncharacterized membrane protein YfcA
MQPVLILSVAFFATFMSSMSGAGSSMITLPCWLMLGFPFPTALVASRNYLKGQKIHWPFLLTFCGLGLIGVFAGVQVAITVNSVIFKRVIGALIICLVAIAASQKKFGLKTEKPLWEEKVVSLFGMPLGFYEAVFGSGNGIFTSFLLCETRGYKLTVALGSYYQMSFVWCLCSALLFLHHGYFAPALVIPSVLGGVLGAYTGSLIGQKGGTKLVKCVFIGVGTIFGIKLLLGA